MSEKAFGREDVRISPVLLIPDASLPALCTTSETHLMMDKGTTGGREALLLPSEQVGDVKDASDRTPRSSDPGMQSSVQCFSTFKFDETVSVRH